MTIMFFVIDMLWLGIFAKNFYQKNLGFLLAENPKWIPAIIFYLSFLVGVIIFAVAPSVEKNSIDSVILLGALFGFFTYATYDLTNFATIKNWPIKIVLVDILWGSTITSIISVAGFWFYGIIK
ncbi:MAG: DUF2177 family protein [Patescibacteria group bacterium]